MLKTLTRWNIIALAILAAGCARMPVPVETSAQPTRAASIAPTAVSPANQSANAPANPSANVPGAFSKTDPQLAPTGIKGDPANGAKLFSQTVGCSGCHDVTKNYPGGEVAPNLANIATISESIIKSPDYKGKAKTVAEYIRESILAPNTYIVPGDEYHRSDGLSVMVQDFAERLTPQQVEDLVAYVLSLKPQ